MIRATLTLPKEKGGSSCSLVRDNADSRSLTLQYTVPYASELRNLWKWNKENIQSEQIINALMMPGCYYPEDGMPLVLREFL